MAYDVARQRTILFGGYTWRGASALGDTWAWDGSRWTQLTPTTSPPARRFHAMTYDRGRQRVVLFGGQSRSLSMLSDTWEWDGTSWVQASPLSGPTGRRWHAMAFDSDRQRSVLFGGQVATGVFPRDTWEWDGTRWTLRASAVRPSAGSGHAMAFDAKRSTVVLFAGSSSSGRLAETWEWDGAVWQKRAAPGPSAREATAMTYDAARERVVLFGGFSNLGPTSDSWEWNGFEWLLHVPQTNPTPRSEHAVAYDEARQCVVLFGGAINLSDTWEYRTTAPGAVRSVGSGCSGPSGTPALSAAGPPIIGNREFSWSVGSAPAQATVFLAVSSAPGSGQFIGSCAIYPLLPFQIVLPSTTSASGISHFPVSIPFDPTLSGIQIHTQGGALVPGGSLLGVASVTAGLIITIGT